MKDKPYINNEMIHILPSLWETFYKLEKENKIMEKGDKVLIGQNVGEVIGFREEEAGSKVQVKLGNLIYWFKEENVELYRKEEKEEEVKPVGFKDKTYWT